MTIPDSQFMLESGASCLPVPADQERRIVEELASKAQADLREGNLYYVVSNRWYSSWQRYVERNSDQHLAAKQPELHSLDTTSSEMADRPGPIDNGDIVSDESSSDGDHVDLRRMLEEEKDYVLVPQEVWEKLLGWYGGGPALPRKMITQGYYQKSFMVEVYLLRLTLIDARDSTHLVIRLSRKATIEELYRNVCSLRNVDVAKAQIWDYFNKQKIALLVNSNKSLEEENLQLDQHILLEVQADGVLPSQVGMDLAKNDLALVAFEPSRSSVTITEGPTTSNDGSNVLSETKGDKGGLAGLQNLGNTCFMNSAIQCLAHTPPIVEYFLQDYTGDININNPLGMEGELALAFGELLRQLWSSGRTSVPPRAFKGKLARFAPQFSGYNQHDSQELLAFLLDGLHEDLNRVKRKPYLEAKDSNGRPDKEVADESWRYHRARNDSIIVDVCQGQYKSTLVCPVCGKISITFDPFMYLTLPLPSSATRTITVTVFYVDGTGLPMPYTVTVPKHGRGKDLNQALGVVCCLRTDERLLLAEVYEHKIFQYIDDFTDLTSIKDNDCLVAYRLPNRGKGKTRLEVSSRWIDRVVPDNLKGPERKYSGTPLVTVLDEESLSGARIAEAITKMLLPLRRVCSTSGVILHKENNIDSSDEVSNSNHAKSEGNHEMDGLEDDLLNNESSPLLHLFLADDRGSNHKPVNRDTVIRPGNIVKILLDWTEKEHELYDASYLKDLPEVHKSGMTAKKTRQEAISLFSCLDAFLKEEPLGPDDMWYCPSCKEHRQATKKLDLWKLPDILVVHLKRFSYSRYFKNKLNTVVNFPIHNLDLTKYVKSEAGHSYVYELYAISNHYGGLGGGHYTAFAKLLDDDRWYHFDDSHVSPVSETDIGTSAAYLLFYQRVRTKTGDTSQPRERESDE
ncbi:hypothetical protein MLD38_027704 [Melastoma candidum]|uniref:Uncharacterized protein n=1 Tax=Melastoma candidum TaxID=119954 RepID=A0ACB9P3J1_9MYRT|nr:hypothetical protein MLD38_027704 [Melastoma candidum]